MRVGEFKLRQKEVVSPLATNTGYGKGRRKASKAGSEQENTLQNI